MTTFVKSAMIATVATYLLIFIGGLVRVSGAGLGCPDWPRCYDSWIPPLNEMHLQQLKMRAEAGTPAAEILAQVNPETFNFTLTWIEYINRLAGVVVGLTIVAMFLVALLRVRHDRLLVAGSGAVLLLTLFEGWLGAVVVRSELHQLMVSLHMGGALLMISMLVYLTILPGYRDAERTDEHRRVRLGLWVLWGFGMVQIAGGAWLRGALENLERAMPLAGHVEHMDSLGALKYLHIILGVAISLGSVALAMQILGKRVDRLCRGAAQAMLVLAILQLIVGFSFRPLGLWPLLQVVHLWITSLWLGSLLILVIGLRHRPGEAEGQTAAVGRWLTGALAVCLVTAAGGIFVIDYAERSREVPIEFTVTAFSLPGAEGAERFTEADLQGRITVLDFIFSRCVAYCPRMTAQMAALYRDFDDPAKVQFISVTLDPEYDTPKVLGEYASRFGVADDRWRFLSGPLEDAKGVARAFHVPEEYINHSTDLILIDAEGRVRGYYDFASEYEMRALREHIKRLAKEYWP